MRRPAPAPPISTSTSIKKTSASFRSTAASSFDSAANAVMMDDRGDEPTIATAPSAPPPGEWLESSTIFPPGLHSLMHLDRVYVARATDGLEAVKTWDTTKRYRVTDAEGQLLYTALEESNPCARFCLSASHSWIFHLLDDSQREVLRFRRALRCSSCCFPCCLQKLTVHANGTMLGTVAQCWNPCRPSFAIRNAADEKVLMLKGPCCLRCGGDAQFRIKSSDGKHRVGAIAKKCTGLAREFIEDGDSVLVGFPPDLDVKIKAVLIGASFLLEYMYLEDGSKNRPSNDDKK